MYLPEAFREERPEVLRTLMEAHPLATLVTASAQGLEANHLPMLFREGKLVGHLARSNPQWQSAHGTEAPAIFHGADSYVSPNSYPTKQEHGRVVPAWNYVAVHGRGTLRVFEDEAELRAPVEQLTDANEQRQAQPWKVSDAPADYVAGLLKRIVGIELTIAKLEGKWKVSRNQPPRNRAGAATAFETEGFSEMARLIRGERRGES